MKKLLCLSLAAATLCSLVGCAHHRDGYDPRDPSCAKEAGGLPWHHPRKTAADFTSEEMICRSIAASRADKAGRTGNIFMIADETRTCLKTDYGWIPGCE